MLTENNIFESLKLKKAKQKIYQQLKFMRKTINNKVIKSILNKVIITGFITPKKNTVKVLK